MESFLVGRGSQFLMKGIPRVGVCGRERRREAAEKVRWISCVDTPGDPPGPKSSTQLRAEPGIACAGGMALLAGACLIL